MKKFKHIYLTGCMGSGKSTVGRLLSKKLGRRLVDLDTVIEQEQGLTINEIFDKYGEEAFREMEHQTLEGLDQHKNLIVATGGGVVINPQNREIMKDRGAIIFLEIPVESLIKRLKGDRSRPLLHGKELKSNLTEILEERDPYYQDYTYKVTVSDKTPLQITNSIIKLLKGRL